MESKSAKKNKKRHNKKTPEFQGTKKTNESSPEFMLEALKEKLAEAKESQDHATAGKLRDQIWVLTDIVAGVRTNLCKEELLPILESIAMPSKSPAGDSTSEASGGDGPKTKPTTSAVDRKLINLQKKLQKIEELKAKKVKGEKLEKNQLQKIETESVVKEEMEELEEMLANASLLR